jgi:hypothetical protein
MFEKCSKCKRKNLEDDNVGGFCGVCGNKLIEVDWTKPMSSNKEKSKNKSVLNFKHFIGLCVLFFLFYKLFHQQKKLNIDFEIIKTELNNRVKFNESIRIKNKISQNELGDLADEIKDNSNFQSEIGVLFFLLPEMKEDNGCWASVIYDPEKKVSIIGQSLEDEKIIEVGAHKLNGYIGLWKNNYLKGDVIIALKKVDNKLFYLQHISASTLESSKLFTKLKYEYKDNGQFYRDIESKNEYYKIEPNGNLSVFDNLGYIETYTRIK